MPAVQAARGSGTFDDPYQRYNLSGAVVPIRFDGWELNFNQPQGPYTDEWYTGCGMSGLSGSSFVVQVYFFATWHGEGEGDPVELARRISLVDKTGHSFSPVPVNSLTAQWQSGERCTNEGDFLLLPPAVPESEARGALYWVVDDPETWPYYLKFDDFVVSSF